MQSFEDLGLREELLRTLEEEDVAEPTALQEGVIPALRRGGNLVARASSGSGKTLAYTLGVLDRLGGSEADEDADEDAGNLRVLILTPTPGEAGRVARAIAPYGQSMGLGISALAAGWGTPAGAAQILVAATGDAIEAVRSSAVKLDRLEAIVIDGAAAIQEVGDWEGVDDLIELAPRDAQRVVVSSAIPLPVEDLIERRVKRALRYPPEAALVEERQTATEGTIAYVVATEQEKAELLAVQLRGREAGPPPVVFCRTDERAAELAEQLTVRGFLVGTADDPEADVAIAAGGVTLAELRQEGSGEVGQTISFDVPPDAATLRARHEGDPDAVVLVQPRELAHIREVAAQARRAARSIASPREDSATVAALGAFRQEVRSAIAQEDLTAQLLILEPLLEEHSPAEVAAALAALLRSRRPVAAPTAGAPAPTAAPPAGEPRGRSGEKSKSASPGPAPVTWARLFVSMGSRDEIRPGDIVGALAGEANIPGSRIGKIEIKDSFSIVEVQSEVADQVIRAVNGTTMKGRSVRVDYDRGGPTRRPPPRGGPARRSTRRPPAP